MIECDDPGASATEFDSYAARYDESLTRGLRLTGEGKDYFAERRIAFLAGCLRASGGEIQTVLDFGCGTGTATPFLLGLPGADSLIGVDPSSQSLEVARLKHRSEKVRFSLPDEHRVEGTVGLAYCNGVFHHIPPPDRAAAVDYVRRALRPGGLFSFWENNPANPATRYVMSRIPFDRDAVTLTRSESRRMLEGAGFEVVRTDFLFLFPRWLSALRPLEARLAKVPLGGQYQILCRKAGREG